MVWHVIYTKPNNELKVTSRLEELGIEVFCPTITKVRQWSDRKKKITVPLIPPYVFVKVDAMSRNKVFDVPGVRRYLFWLGKHALVKESEINALKEWNNLGTETTLWTEGFTPGDRVHIASGEFKNQNAIIKEVGKNQVKLLLPSLGFSVCMTTKAILKRIG